MGLDGVAVLSPVRCFSTAGERRPMALDAKRGPPEGALLDAMPYPKNVDNHFVDPSEFDFYAMDNGTVGENRLARELSEEVIRVSTFNNQARWPTRAAEAYVTFGVVAAREGDLDEAIVQGRQAITGERQSLPSLALVAQDLASVLTERYDGEPEADEYLEQLRSIQQQR
jgi:hypothetical protein